MWGPMHKFNILRNLRGIENFDVTTKRYVKIFFPTVFANNYISGGKVIQVV